MYFERATPSGSFVEVEVVGASLVRRWGQIGAQSAKQREERFSSNLAAAEALARQIRGLQGKGYTLGHSHSGLIQAIERAPDEPGPYLVYADWLLERGDVRGELIMRMSQGREALASAWLKEHPELVPDCWQPQCADLEWRLGFIRRITFNPRGRWMWEQPLMLRRLLRHPSSWFVRELVLDQVQIARDFGLLEVWQGLLAGRRPALQNVLLRRSPGLDSLAQAFPGVVREEGGG